MILYIIIGVVICLVLLFLFLGFLDMVWAVIKWATILGGGVALYYYSRHKIHATLTEWDIGALSISIAFYALFAGIAGFVIWRGISLLKDKNKEQ